MSDNFAKVAQLATTLYETLVTETLEADYRQADETTVPVLNKDKKGATHKGYYWLFLDSVNKLVVFDY